MEVFKQLLAELPVDTGFAIVVIQHLDPNHHSLLAEILTGATAMPVHEAADGMAVQANHVYVIPANVDMILASGNLKLTARSRAPGLHLPIDGFLRSMADQCGGRAIGVILSGAGSDGAAGVAAIKAGGGMTFAQDEATAKFASMPQAAVATGCVDFVLSPKAIAAELVRIGRHPYLAEINKSPAEIAPAAEEAQIARILGMLQKSGGIDFSLYREKMVKRRILRRMALRNVTTLGDYIQSLAKDPEELQSLQQDMLISVTSFFRDRDSFEGLKQVVFPSLLKDRPATETVRVWVAGCATGEEAFSLAILLQEYMRQTGATFPVQIFASDISLPALEKARSGRYLENIAEDVNPERLNSYFTKTEDGYQVNKNLREMCVFTRHNLVGDPPFSKLDLITCRNVLIYLGNVQKNITPLFHYALKQGGFLMLGASEGGAADDMFEVVDAEHRIYIKRESAKRRPVFPSGISAARRPEPAVAKAWGGTDVRREVDRILLSRYSPAGVVVDDDLEVIEIRGKAGAYLTLPAGKVSFNLMKLIPDTGLFLEVEKLIERSQTTGEQTRQEGVGYEHNGISTVLNLEALPLNPGQNPGQNPGHTPGQNPGHTPGHSRSTLVLFEPVPDSVGGETAQAAVRSPADTRDSQILQLKQQLARAKERFLTATEAHQNSREEIQNTTEEALSANEELQSLNEELETAKEELQSTNEELNTVNQELQGKNAALGEARDFALSIVETVRQPLLVLDAGLRIRMANRAFCQTFQTSSKETEGQTVYLMARGIWDFLELRNALESLLGGGDSFADFEVERDFPAIGRRTLVIGGRRVNHLKTILLAVDDVTERKVAQQTLLKIEEHLRQSQKMEAVGRLAGGVAHDFNNLLTAIIGYSGLLQDSLAENSEALQQVAEIQRAGEKAAALTQQLLAFSRRQILRPKRLDLNAIVADFDRMLRRLVGERIQLLVRCAPDLRPVLADPGELGRAIMNLALNARDAMPAGGRLTIETENVSLTPGEASAENLSPGQYVRLSVRDTGVGIDNEVRAHIFEPFFTTKAMGKGTGLGLATVLGIVEQSGGAIHCESKLGEGTVFRVLLPAVERPVEPGERPAGNLVDAPKGTEVVLLVEDEEAVRNLARTILESRGYVVLHAANGREGLALCETHQGHIDVLVTDVVMPELGGRELAEGALKMRPQLKVLFMSGHTQDEILQEGLQKGGPYLPKPFTPLALAQKVRETLDSTATPVGL